MKKTNEPYCHFRGRTLFDGDGFSAHNSDEFGGYVGPLSPTIRSSKSDAAVCLLVDDEPDNKVVVVNGYDEDTARTIKSTYGKTGHSYIFHDGGYAITGIAEYERQG